MSKGGFNYFDAFGKQASYSEEMSLNLASAIRRGELGTKGLLESLHTFENDADAVNHQIQKHLASDFVVPLERGGMNELANALDDVADEVEDIAIEAYIRGLEELPAGGQEMISHLAEAVSDLYRAVDLLHDMPKQNPLILKHCVKVQSAESACDAVFIELARTINTGDEPFEYRHAACAVILAIEKAMDAVETAAEIVEAIVAENA